MNQFIENDDTLLQLLLAKFLSQLTRYQRQNFCDILQLLKKCHQRTILNQDKTDINNIILNTPRTDAEIRNIYLSDKKSIFQNLPIPQVKEIDKHSYVSIKECISNFLL